MSLRIIPLELTDVTAHLVHFASSQMAAGAACEINAETPVLEMGLLDSLSMVSLLTYIHAELGVAIPDEDVLPENFESLGKLSDLVVRIRQTGSMPAAKSRPNALEESVRILESSGIRRRWVNLTSGVRMHMLESKGTGPAMVLLPGLGNPASSWGGVLRSVHGDRSAFAVDLPGFGFSEAANAAPGFADQVEAVLALMREAMEPPFILVGSSAGAMIATEIARRKPGWLSALVITGFGLVPDPPRWRQGLEELSGSPERFLASAYYRPPQLTEAVEGLMKDVMSKPAYHSFLDADGMESMPRAFEGLRVHTLFVAGERDRIVPPEWVEAAAARVPRARLEWLARCGHFAPAEQPEELMYVINNYLNSLAEEGVR